MAKRVLTDIAQLRVTAQTTVISIISSAVNKEIGRHNRITNATLELQVEEVSGTGFNVEAQGNGGAFEIIDYISPQSGSKVYIDITEELNDIIKNNDETVNLRITGNFDRHISFKEDDDDDKNIKLEVEYIPERIMYDNNEYYEISAGKAGKGKINLATGGLNYVHEDSAASGISHIYNGWQAGKTSVDFDNVEGEDIKIDAEYGCGKGWKLNLHQYLVKRKGTEKQDLYTYVDGDGNYHEFTERYYYETSDKKVYVNKADISIDFDNKLTAYGEKVKTELKTTSGLTLSAELTDFNGIEKLELRSEDRAKLENNIEQLEDEKERLENQRESFNDEKERIKDEEQQLEDQKEQIEKEEQRLKDYIEDLIQTQYADATGEEFKNLIAAEKEVERLNLAYQKMEIPSTLPISLMNQKGLYLGSDKLGLDYREEAIKRQVDLSYKTKKSDVPNVGAYNADFSFNPSGSRFTYNDADGKFYVSQSTQNEHKSNEYNTSSNGYDGPSLYNLDAACYYRNKFEDDCAKIQQDAQQNSYIYELINFYNHSELVAAQNTLKKRQDDYKRDHRISDRTDTVFARAQKSLQESQKELNERIPYLKGTNLKALESLPYSLEKIEKELQKIPQALEKIENLLESQKFQLKRLKEQEPTRYLLDGSGGILAFNEAGILVAIADAYENASYISYEDGKIVSVKDTDGKETALEYDEDGLLARIIDIDEKVTAFDYVNGNLTRISYHDGTKSEFTYVRQLDLLQSAVNPSGYGVKFIYSNKLYKIYRVEEFTNAYEITDEGWRGLDNEDGEVEAETRLLTYMTYNTHLSTTQTDRLGASKTCIFDILGRSVTVFEGVYEDYGDDTISSTVDYNGAKQAFNITDKVGYDNLIKKIPGADLKGSLTGNPAAEAEKVYTLYDKSIPETHSNIPDGASDFVFSAWVKADSAFIPSERKTNYSYTSTVNEYSEEKDSNKKNRKFELSAELTYEQEVESIEAGKCDPKNDECSDEACECDAGTKIKHEIRDGKITKVTTVRFKANFDWLNTGWQYLALPVTIDEEDRVGDRFVGKFPFELGSDGRELVRMTVSLDYSYNVNGRYDGIDGRDLGMQFNCVTLRQGSWKYSRLDADGKTTYSEESESGNKTEYAYDNKNNLVRAVVKDKQKREFVNTYEYNKQRALIRKTDYNGLVEETVYDEKGREKKSFTYNIADPTSKFYSESVKDEKGRILADIDITGEFNSAEYGYDHKGAVTVVTDALGGKTAYGYHNDNLVSVSGTADDEENANTLKHTLGYTTRVSSGGTDYTYTYDGWGKQKTVAIAGVDYSTTEYPDDYSTKVTLATGEIFNSQRDEKNDELSEIVVGGEVYKGKAVRTGYAAGGQEEQEQTVSIYNVETGLLTLAIDKSGQTQYTATYKYDNEGRLVSKIEDGFGTLEQDTEYNDKGLVKQTSYTVNDTKTIDYRYKYDLSPDNRLNAVILPNYLEQTVAIDGLGRVRDISLGEKFSKEIYYKKYGDHATNYVASVYHSVDGKEENTRYSYDKKGNITSVRENGKEVARYAYDSLDRLIREDNALYEEKTGNTVVVGKTETYEYDNNGNILARTKYSYTTKDIIPSEARNLGERTEYGYDLTGWRDQLLSVNGEVIGDYDALGNPWKYRNKNLKWEKGRNLVKCGDNAYAYNAGGIRTSKTINGVEVVYYLDGTKIIAEERGSTEKLYYHYSIDGIAGFEHNGSNYVYRKNVQGDITHIYTANGEEVAKYIYDAWGNHNTYAKSGYEQIAKLNPFRYRSYYFDTESSLYYLQSRYYDSEIGRFINADAVSYLDSETINGLNLYAYCCSNPVMLCDPTGKIAILTTLLIGALIGAAIGGAFEVGKQIVANGWNPANWDGRQILLAIVGGAVQGLITAIPAGWIMTAFLWGTAAVANSLITGAIDVSNGLSKENWMQIGTTFAVGAIAGVAFKSISVNVSARAAKAIDSKILNYTDKVLVAGQNGIFKPSYAFAAEALKQTTGMKVLLSLANPAGNLGGAMIAKAFQMIVLQGIKALFN